LHAVLAGLDGPRRRALPAGEFLHPLPLAATLLLFVNDHLLKGSGALPPVVTGKLSDLCGLLLFPLLLTATLDTAAMVGARLGAPIDFSLRRWKLALAIAATGLAFAATKLSPAAALAGARALEVLGVDAVIVSDPTDLIALPMLAVAWWLGRREIARVPLGRLEVIALAHGRGGPGPQVLLADVAACADDPRSVTELAAALASYHAGGPDGPVTASLMQLRGLAS
jgi:hypothetical protein